MGKQKTPIEHLIRKPGVTYAKNDPNLNPALKPGADAKDSKDGYKPTGALPADPKGDVGSGLKAIPKLDPSKLPPPPMKP